MKIFKFQPNKVKAIKIKKGITLIETLISSTLISFLLLSTASVLLHAIAVKHRSEARTIAAEKTAMQLEKLKSLSFENQNLKEGDNYSLDQLPFWPDEIILSWNIEDINPYLKKIHILCYSKNHLRQNSEIILYLSKHLGF